VTVYFLLACTGSTLYERVPECAYPFLPSLPLRAAHDYPEARETGMTFSFRLAAKSGESKQAAEVRLNSRIIMAAGMKDQSQSILSEPDVPETSTVGPEEQ
jgi:hypothetical protein